MSKTPKRGQCSSSFPVQTTDKNFFIPLISVEKQLDSAFNATSNEKKPLGRAKNLNPLLPSSPPCW